MAKSTLKYISVIFFFFSPMVIWGQNIAQNPLSFTLNRVTLFGLVPENSNIKLSFNPALEAGNAIVSGTVDSSIWINYSIAVSKEDPLKNISVSLDRLIPGVDIILEAQKASGGAKGALGSPVSNVAIGITPVVVITGIGGSSTGIKVNNGHRLDYSLKVNDYSKLVKSTNEIVTVTYTISN
ncbi:hypothetical protein ACYSNM_05015 [Myroides sp. LJL116]